MARSDVALALRTMEEAEGIEWIVAFFLLDDLNVAIKLQFGKLYILHLRTANNVAVPKDGIIDALIETDSLLLTFASTLQQTRMPTLDLDVLRCTDSLLKRMIAIDDDIDANAITRDDIFARAFITGEEVDVILGRRREREQQSEKYEYDVSHEERVGYCDLW